MRKYVCSDVNYDATTGVCADPQWVEDTGIFPPLSASDGGAISAAIVGVWVAAAAFRWAKQALFN